MKPRNCLPAAMPDEGAIIRKRGAVSQRLRGRQIGGKGRIMRGFWRRWRGVGSACTSGAVAGLLALASAVADDPATKPVVAAAEQPKAIGDSAVKPQPGVVASEFVYETAPFPQCHATTLAETTAGLVTAW